jgi:hypothetical protein
VTIHTSEENPKRLWHLSEHVKIFCILFISKMLVPEGIKRTTKLVIGSLLPHSDINDREQLMSTSKSVQERCEFFWCTNALRTSGQKTPKNGPNVSHFDAGPPLVQLWIRRPW